jgi:somatostatin receptor 2
MAFCRTNPEFYNLQLALIYVDSFFTLVMPLFIVPILGLQTIYSSVEASRRSDRLHRFHVSRRRISPHSAVTRLLLAVALVFVILHTPSHIIRIKVTIEKLMGKAQTVSVVDRVLQQLFLTLYHLNYAVNIFIYICCGRRFRKVLYERVRQLSSKESSQNNRLNVNNKHDKVGIGELIRLSHSFLIGWDHIETML